MKCTNVKELEVEVNAYMTECARLKELTTKAVRVSGEIEIGHL